MLARDLPRRPFIVPDDWSNEASWAKFLQGRRSVRLAGVRCGQQAQMTIRNRSNDMLTQSDAQLPGLCDSVLHTFGLIAALHADSCHRPWRLDGRQHAR